MKFKRVLQGCLISILLGSIFTMNVSALTVYQVYFTGYMQRNTNWCWVASAETSAKHMTSSQHDQYSTVYYLKGTNTNPYPNVGGTVVDIAKAANYISGNKYSYVGINSIKTYFSLAAQLDSNKIPIATAFASNGTGHATPIVGIYIYNDLSVGIGYYNPANGKTDSCTFNQFSNGSYNGRSYTGTCYIE